MNRLRWVIMALAIVGGLSMSSFYDWSGEDQSRAAPIVRWLALGLVAINLSACAGLIWYSRNRPATTEATHPARPKFRFGIIGIMAATTLVAIAVAAQVRFNISVGTLLVVAVTAYALWTAFKRSEHRWAICALLTCTWAPFLWIFRWPEFKGVMLHVLQMMAQAPSLMVAGWISMLTRRNFPDVMQFCSLCTAIELSIGLWLIHLGPRRGLAYTLWVLMLSLFSSFLLQALARM